MSDRDLHTLVQQAQSHIQRGKLSEARALYEQICRTDPRDAETRMTLGALKGELGDTAGAEDDLRQALALQPDLAEANFQLGGLLRMQGREQEAVARLRQAVTAKPDYAEAWIVLGGLHGQLGQME